MKKISKAGNIISLILAVILIFGGFGGLAELDDKVFQNENEIRAILNGIILFSLVVLVLVIISLIKPENSPIKIVLICLIGLTAILEFIGGGIVYGCLFLVPIVFYIISLVSKEDIEVKAIEPQKTIDDKIAELRKLKDENVISEEQFNEALKELVSNIVK